MSRTVLVFLTLLREHGHLSAPYLRCQRCVALYHAAMQNTIRLCHARSLPLIKCKVPASLVKRTHNANTGAVGKH